MVERSSKIFLSIFSSTSAGLIIMKEQGCSLIPQKTNGNTQT